MDVLDHSCSKLGFGGKMCVDGTFKYPEEMDDRFQLIINNDQIIIDSLLKERFPEIHSVNSSLLAKQIPCLIISVKKNRRGHIKELHEKVCSLKETAGVKMILYVEHTVDANDLPIALWRFCNNLDPKRDHILYKTQGTRHKVQGADTYFACMGFDGTRKTKEFDDFNRDWPNIIIADSET